MSFLVNICAEIKFKVQSTSEVGSQWTLLLTDFVEMIEKSKIKNECVLE